MINPTHIDEQVTLLRDVEVITIPFGSKTNLKKGETGQITQALGGSYTVMIGGNLFRIDGNDADAIGKEKPEPAQKSNDIDDLEIDEKAVWDVMKTCYDPEIPVNIVDLGLIYSCEFETKENGDLYGSIKPKEISQYFNDNFDETIHPSQIDLKQEINKTGNFSLSVNLHSDIAIELRVIVEKIVTK